MADIDSTSRAASTPSVTCPACGDEHPSPDGTDDFLARNIVRCDVCNARIVYGELAGRFVIEPVVKATAIGPKDFMHLRIQDPITKADVFVGDLDPQYAFMIAQTIIAMVRP